MENRIVKYGFQKISYDQLRSSSILKGSNLQNSGHVFNVVEYQTLSHPQSSFIKACVLRQTSINQPPYKVQINVSTIN